MKNNSLLTIFLIIFLKSQFLFADDRFERLFEFQQDKSEYNVHILYLLAKDSVDRDYDVSGFWIPNEVYCLKNNGNFDHKDLHKFNICNSKN
ncbi:hypothetical protein OAJ82_00065 [Alphaproteobacteria bacterium]|nr:hypothetical protein [Alphaproteobacteria bacterium]